jgi:riboflavin kinase/FMN adenylyltransferase
MEIHHGYKGLNLNKPVVTLGVFDGVHRGHRVLLDTLVRRASERKRESAVITFDPPPRLVMGKEGSKASCLSSLAEKIRLLEKTGIDHLIIIRFTPSFSRIQACDFVEKILAGRLATYHLVVGHDHHFGQGAEGNIGTFDKCASTMGFMVEQVAGLKSKRGFISSSLIREALINGDLNNANKWLGYSYSVGGIVVAGKKLGREIGFPTANIKPDFRYKLIPANGVYAVDIEVDGEMKPGMLSIGTNPTVNRFSIRKFIEANIFDFGRDIYGKHVEVFFRYRLRDEIRFDSVEELSRQMERDRDLARKVLGQTTSL